MGEGKEFAVFLIFDDYTPMLCGQKFHLISLIQIGKQIRYLSSSLESKWPFCNSDLTMIIYHNNYKFISIWSH